MQLKYTIHGTDARAQIQVIDLTGESISLSIRKDKPRVYAYILPDYANKFTPFCLGEQVYWGHNVEECVNLIKERLKLADIELPLSFSQYK